MSYPTNKTTLPQTLATDKTDAVDHNGIHNNLATTINALQDKVGINSDTATTSHDYKLSGVTGTDKAVSKTGTETLTNKTLTSPTINTPTISTPAISNATSTGTDSGSETLSNKTLVTPTISSSGFTNANHAHDGATTGGQLNATNVFSAGTMPTVRLGSGTANATTYLRGDQTWSPITVNTKYGGTGVDGALALTSGTTNIDVGGVAKYTKNYTSISITSTGKLTFSNPHSNGTIVILKSQGAITLTSSTVPCIDVSSMGSSSATAGNTNMMVFIPASGNGGNPPDNSTSGAGGTASSAIGVQALPVSGVILSVGTGGGSGGVSNGFGRGGGGGAGGHNAFSTGTGGSTGGLGGVSGGGTSGTRGGGALYIEGNGTYNATGTINANGANGTSASDGSGASGGGGGGCIVIRYGTLTTDTGTYNVNAGTSGTASNGGGNAGSAGAGYSDVAINTDLS